VLIVRQIDFTDDATELYNSNQYYRQTSLGPYSALYAYPRPLAPCEELKTHPTAVRATFRIPHITHRSAVTFRTFHSAFYLPHAAIPHFTSWHLYWTNTSHHITLRRQMQASTASVSEK